MATRKEIEAFVIKYVGKISRDKRNEELYKEFFKKMSNTEFSKWVDDLDKGNAKIQIIVPNGSSKLSIENNYKVAKELGVEFYQYLDIGPTEDTPKYRTPMKVLIYDSMVRRVSQLLMKKISIPEDNRRIDTTTGAVTGSSKGSKMTMPELTILTNYGLKDSLSEIMTARGGDLGKGRAMEAYLDKYGQVSLSNLESFKTGVVSSKTLTAYLNACHLKANVQG